MFVEFGIKASYLSIMLEMMFEGSGMFMHV